MASGKADEDGLAEEFSSDVNVRRVCRLPRDSRTVGAMLTEFYGDNSVMLRDEVAEDSIGSAIKEKTRAKCRVDMSDGDIAVRVIWSWRPIDYKFLTPTTFGDGTSKSRNFALHFRARFDLLANVLGFFWLSLDYLSIFPTKEQGKRDWALPTATLSCRYDFWQPRDSPCPPRSSRQESKPEQYFPSSGRAIVREKTAFIFATNAQLTWPRAASDWTHSNLLRGRGKST